MFIIIMCSFDVASQYFFYLNQTSINTVLQLKFFNYSLRTIILDLLMGILQKVAQDICEFSLNSVTFLFLCNNLCQNISKRLLGKRYFTQSHRY